MVATRSSPRICSLDASEDSSTTSRVFENEARRLRSPLAVPRPSMIPSWRARNRCSVSDAIPDSRSSVRAAEADGARPAALWPRLSASVRSRFSIVVLPVPA